MVLSVFPFLLPAEFESACRDLADRCTSAQSAGGWFIRLVTQEALVRTGLNPKLQVDYDIVLSPTYQVPVLYFALRWHHYDGPVGLDAVYRYVVPEQYQRELKSVGIMGGISFGYHPESGSPAFFVHPCNTADAMAQVTDARSATAGTYLLIWLGLVGHCVNLHISRELVTSDSAGLS
ncbi:Autophagy-related protein 3 [Penicillium longicatenatum]|uniref:Autophagy-related protein 3 n=1 Tax=Penicillium longicatenatum TaxID=1561947 RepID=UPI002546BCD9|nr:Autophagy-related protein 3 [Penicillium longicatenatum]KAJ5650054.1 Autophagy-related protein 3 [Penicillium longicatenatum]